MTSNNSSNNSSNNTLNKEFNKLKKILYHRLGNSLKNLFNSLVIVYGILVVLFLITGLFKFFVSKKKVISLLLFLLCIASFICITITGIYLKNTNDIIVEIEKLNKNIIPELNDYEVINEFIIKYSNLNNHKNNLTITLMVIIFLFLLCLRY